MRLKKFKLGHTRKKFQAEACLRGILINPKLPTHFFCGDIADRSSSELEKWENLVFARGNYKNGYRLFCLDHGAWDRPSEYDHFATLADLINRLATV